MRCELCPCVATAPSGLCATHDAGWLASPEHRAYRRDYRAWVDLPEEVEISAEPVLALSVGKYLLQARVRAQPRPLALMGAHP